MEASLFKKRRKKVSKFLGDNSIAIIAGNTKLPKSADQYFPFRQDSNFFYLSGLLVPDSILIILSKQLANEDEAILLSPTVDAEKAVWDGEGYSIAEMKKTSGIGKILPLEKMEEIITRHTADVSTIFLIENDQVGLKKRKLTPQYHFIQYLQRLLPLHRIESLMPLMKKLRMVKDQSEINAIQKCIAISKLAFHSLAEMLVEGINERELAAELSRVFQENEADHSFHPIIASGINACTLHYHQNNASCIAGDLLLLDFGASLNYYNADITRVLPVNGKFTKRQKQIYQAVLKAKNFATSLMFPGKSMKEWQQEVGRFIQSELKELGILSSQEKDDQAYKKYFMHGVGHHLGIDVHDLSDKTEVFQQGMVLTCEPGLYIPEEKIGIRLEDDIFISEKGPVNLSGELPIELEEVEHLMAGG